MPLLIPQALTVMAATCPALMTSCAVPWVMLLLRILSVLTSVEVYGPLTATCRII